MKSNKEMIKEAGFGLTKSIIILIVVVIFKLSFTQTAIIVLGSSAVISLWAAWRRSWPAGWSLTTARSLIVTTFVLLIIFGIYEIAGGYTLWAFLLVVFIISGFILWSKRQEYLEVIRHVERQVWGETMEERRERKKK